MAKNKKARVNITSLGAEIGFENPSYQVSKAD